MRKPATAILLLLWMGFWIVAAVTVGGLIAGWPHWAHLIYYVVAGIGWIIPLKPLFAWMNRGAVPPEED
ncbi:MAG: DUF2842 domain-containing protein [Hyphomonas sp.]|uniref:DUF2842 domain-containing protein n=1 Tax=Hyphomonas sp. TaxID=87 RepID=UPI0035277589